MKKKSTPFLVLALTLILPSLQARTLKVLKSQGDVLLNGKALVPDQALPAGGILIAKGKDSYVDMSLNGGGKLRLKNGRLELNNPAAESWRVKLTGQLFAFFKKAKARQSFIIQTDAAVAGVRGTKFLIQADPGDTYLCVCEGEVEMKSHGDGKGPGKKVKAGFDLHARSEARTKQPSQATEAMWNMTAGEFESMGVKVEKPE